MCRAARPRVLAAVFAAGLLAGCASNVPLEIRERPPGAVSPAEVLNDPEGTRGRPLRWGGTIAVVRNSAEYAELEVVARPLTRWGEPLTGDESIGRFRARAGEFLDPEIYRTGREVTVYGTADGVVSGRVDQRPYVFPLVRAARVYLWPEYDYVDYGPYWPDHFPWYPYGYPYPYWPYGYHYPGPYYGYRPHHHHR